MNPFETMALAWLRQYWRWVAGVVALVAVGLICWRLTRPVPKPPAVVPQVVVQAQQEASRDEGRAEVLEEQADAVGTRADAVEQQIHNTKPKPAVKPLENEDDEAVARDLTDALRGL